MEQNVVSVFRDRERVGYKRYLATEIEGTGKLAKLLERKQRFDSELRNIDAIENYCNFLKDYYYFNEGDIDVIVDIYQKVPRPLLKNPYAFVLGYILNRDKDINRIRLLLSKHDKTKTISKVDKRGIQRDIASVTDLDVIRYKRLIETYV